LTAQAPAEPTPAGAEDRSRTWRWTALTGVSLLVLVTIHMIAHHFVVEEIGGLRTYDQVLEYIANPLIFVIEGAFLVVVTIHAMLGLRSVVFDLGIGARARRLVNKGLVALGSVTVVYGFVLIGVLASRA
jgi:succinate dehydrogenase hydrophobic anchor subunit